MDPQLNHLWPPERIYRRFNPLWKPGPGLRVNYTPIPPRLSFALLDKLRAGMDSEEHLFTAEFAQVIQDEHWVPLETAASLAKYKTFP